MKKLSLMPDKGIILTLAKAYESIRLEKGLTEQEVSQRGGVSKDAIQRFKKGENIGLKNFIGILKGIDRLEKLLLVLPEEVHNPLVSVKPIPKRQRIRKKKKEAKKKKFVWGDER